MKKLFLLFFLIKLYTGDIQMNPFGHFPNEPLGIICDVSIERFKDILVLSSVNKKFYCCMRSKIDNEKLAIANWVFERYVNGQGVDEIESFLIRCVQNADKSIPFYPEGIDLHKFTEYFPATSLPLIRQVRAFIHYFNGNNRIPSEEIASVFNCDHYIRFFDRHLFDRFVLRSRHICEDVQIGYECGVKNRIYGLYDSYYRDDDFIDRYFHKSFYSFNVEGEQIWNCEMGCSENNHYVPKPDVKIVKKSFLEMARVICFGWLPSSKYKERNVKIVKMLEKDLGPATKESVSFVDNHLEKLFFLKPYEKQKNDLGFLKKIVMIQSFIRSHNELFNIMVAQLIVRIRSAARKAVSSLNAMVDYLAKENHFDLLGDDCFGEIFKHSVSSLQDVSNLALVSKKFSQKIYNEKRDIAHWIFECCVEKNRRAAKKEFLLIRLIQNIDNSIPFYPKTIDTDQFVKFFPAKTCFSAIRQIKTFVHYFNGNNRIPLEEIALIFGCYNYINFYNRHFYDYFMYRVRNLNELLLADTKERMYEFFEKNKLIDRYFHKTFDPKTYNWEPGGLCDVGDYVINAFYWPNESQGPIKKSFLEIAQLCFYGNLPENLAEMLKKDLGPIEKDPTNFIDDYMEKLFFLKRTDDALAASLKKLEIAVESLMQAPDDLEKPEESELEIQAEENKEAGQRACITVELVMQVPDDQRQTVEESGLKVEKVEKMSQEPAGSFLKPDVTIQPINDQLKVKENELKIRRAMNFLSDEWAIKKQRKIFLRYAVLLGFGFLVSSIFLYTTMILKSV